MTLAFIIAITGFGAFGLYALTVLSNLIGG